MAAAHAHAPVRLVLGLSAKYIVGSRFSTLLAERMTCSLSLMDSPKNVVLSCL
jgi:hypothetical protein